MSIEVRLPELGGSITHAKLSTWLKHAGDAVTRGEPIAEVETDKTSVEIEAPGDGVLVAIEVPAGTDKVAVNDLLAIISAEGAGPVAMPAAVDAMSAVPARTPEAAARSRADGDGPAGPAPDASSPAGAAPAPLTGDDVPDAAIAASPLARRMAAAAGIRLSRLKGTGPNGRITKSDVEAVLRPRPGAASAQALPATAPRSVPAPDDDPARYETVTLSTMRRVTAERLAVAKQTIPHFYLRADCAMDAVSRIRNEVNARGREKLSLTAFALRAAALALKRVPAANAMWDNGAVRLYDPVDLAVAVNTPSGLIAPVVRNAHEKPVPVLNQELRDLSERARGGRLRPEDYTGGTCTVSNLGMFGITSLYPIVNPPQTCILGLGAVDERPVVRDHALAVGLVMTCTLSADHRALDGAVGAEFLSAFRQLIEDPWSLLL
jgi:pyruvate dehydrogenase E2 component (dihydrolipoamide acetyltransferase)